MMKNDDYVLDALYCIPMPPSLRQFARIMKEKGGFEGMTIEEREWNWNELVDVGFYFDYYLGTIKLASQRYGKDFRNTPKKPLPNGTFDQPSMVVKVKKMDDKYRKMWQNETNRDECPLVERTWDGVY